jgi:hypothetical protein
MGREQIYREQKAQGEEQVGKEHRSESKCGQERKMTDGRWKKAVGKRKP